MLNLNELKTEKVEVAVIGFDHFGKDCIDLLSCTDMKYDSYWNDLIRDKELRLSYNSYELNKSMVMSIVIAERLSEDLKKCLAYFKKKNMYTLVIIPSSNDKELIGAIGEFGFIYSAISNTEQVFLFVQRLVGTIKIPGFICIDYYDIINTFVNLKEIKLYNKIGNDSEALFKELLNDLENDNILPSIVLVVFSFDFKSDFRIIEVDKAVKLLRTKFSYKELDLLYSSQFYNDSEFTREITLFIGI